MSFALNDENAGGTDDQMLNRLSAQNDIVKHPVAMAHQLVEGLASGNFRRCLQRQMPFLVSETDQVLNEPGQGRDACRDNHDKVSDSRNLIAGKTAHKRIVPREQKRRYRDGMPEDIVIKRTLTAALGVCGFPGQTIRGKWISPVTSV